jgi:hypothetical protein
VFSLVELGPWTRVIATASRRVGGFWLLMDAVRRHLIPLVRWAALWVCLDMPSPRSVRLARGMVLFGLVRVWAQSYESATPGFGAMPLPSSQSPDRVRQSRGRGRNEAPDFAVA